MIVIEYDGWNVKLYDTNYNTQTRKKNNASGMSRTATFVISELLDTIRFLASSEIFQTQIRLKQQLRKPTLPYTVARERYFIEFTIKLIFESSI